MGQDDRCGICGKHYQSCKHYLKIHVLKPLSQVDVFCGRSNSDLLTEDLGAYNNDSIDPEDFCLQCIKTIGHPPGNTIIDYEFMYSLEENQ